MLRVLHVLEAVRGGTSRHVADIVASAPDVEHHVVVPHPDRAATRSGAVTDIPAVTAMSAHGAVIHHLDMRRSLTHPANPVAVARLVALAGRVHPDVMHGHSSIGGALARLAGPRRRIPVVYTPNGLATGPAAVHIEKILARATAILVAVSASEAHSAVARGIIPSDRVRVIPNGIDLSPPPHEAPDLRERCGLARDAVLVGTVARLVEQKSPEDFVAVVAAASAAGRSNLHGLLIGMGPLQGEVDRAVERLGLAGRFHQIEHLPQAWAALDQLDVFVLPSRFEGGPYTPLEAMRAGVPVVLSDVVGNRDAVECGRSGILCPFGDTDAMALAVVDLIDHPQERRAMTTSATERLVERFDLRLMGAALTELYRSLARGALQAP